MEFLTNWAGVTAGLLPVSGWCLGGGGGARLRPSGGFVLGLDSFWIGFFDLGRSLGPPWWTQFR